jgi:signal transduction histidine kinase
VLVDYDTERVRLQVADTGAGIPADKLETIFEPFVQVNRTLSTANDGVGLGLAISRDLARAMGGDLTVESRLSSGSTFTVHLKRAQNGGDGMVAR